MAARVIAELRNAQPFVIHLAHPYPVNWTFLFTSFSSILRLPLVPYSQWLEKLELSAADHYATEQERASLNPALRLLNFFRAALISNSATEGEGNLGIEALGLRKMDLKNSVEGSDILKGARKLSESDVRLWVTYWRNIGYLPHEIAA